MRDFQGNRPEYADTAKRFEFGTMAYGTALGAEILGPRDPADRSATVAARFPGKNSADFARTLKQADVIAAPRRDFIRFSPRLYNSSEDIDSEDIDQVLAAIKAAL